MSINQLKSQCYLWTLFSLPSSCVMNRLKSSRWRFQQPSNPFLSVDYSTILSVSIIVASRGRVIDGWWTRKNLKGNGRSVIFVNIPAIDCRHLDKYEHPVRIAIAPVGIRTERLWNAGLDQPVLPWYISLDVIIIQYMRFWKLQKI
jgi:hypothetical protein